MGVTSYKAQVLIVGAGPVGLALAIELGMRGVEVILVEERSRSGAQPRAKTTNIRTMAHMRRWGISEKLREAAPLPRDFPTDVVFSTTLFGFELAVIENAFDGAKRDDSRYPEPAQWVPQYIVEEVMRERLKDFASVRTLFARSLIDAVQDSHVVKATILDKATGQQTFVEADFMVGADGARSRVRELIGAKMKGAHAYAQNLNLILRAPELARNPPARQAIMHWIVNAESPGVFCPLDQDGLWAFSMTLPPGKAAITDEEINKRVEKAVGRSIKFEIVTRDIWAAHRLIASSYRRGKIFLVGDACHLHPPYGGYGMNLGIADSVDLGWKLSAVVEGWGTDAILDSYEVERRPIHELTIEEAVTNYAALSDKFIQADLEGNSERSRNARAVVGHEILATKTREFHTSGIVLGAGYEMSPFIASTEACATPRQKGDYVPSARPGSLAPHAWLSDGVSLYDQFGSGFTLLRLGEDSGVSADIEAAALKADVPMRVVDVKHDGILGVYGEPLALIRPDQYVAWRGASCDATALIGTLLGAQFAAPPNQVEEIPGCQTSSCQ